MPQIKDISLYSVPVVEPEAALDEVIQMMRSEPLHAVALVNEGQFLGLFTQNDLDDTSLIPPHVDRSLLSVGPYVHPLRVIAHPEESTRVVLDLMKRHDLSSAPVVLNRTFLGMVTRADLEKAA